MKAKNILNIGLAGLLSLHIAGCAKPLSTNINSEKSNKLEDYILYDEDIKKEFDTTIDALCYLTEIDATNRLITKEGGLPVVIKRFKCYKPENAKTNDRYVVAYDDYDIILSTIKNERINIYVPFCAEDSPYVRAYKLSDNKILILVDEERDGKPDYGLRPDFPKDKLPAPVEINDKECPKFGTPI